MNPKWIEPESRLIINGLFRRNFDTFSDEARRVVNWGVLIGDVVAAIIVLNML
ncbi:MAG: hypothetical protein V3S29_03060 [bacterium]